MELVDEIRRLVGLAERLRGPVGNQANTRAVLIEPMLSALGWDTTDLEQTVRDWPTRDNSSIDYALKVGGANVVFVETRGANESIDDRGFIAETVNRVGSEGIAWCVLTNGLIYRVYKANESAGLDEKLLLEVDLTSGTADAPDGFAKRLSLLARQSVIDGSLGRWGDRFFTDPRVHEALTQLAANPSAAFLQAVAEAIGDPEVPPDRLRESLARVFDRDGEGAPEAPPAQTAQAPRKLQAAATPTPVATPEVRPTSAPAAPPAVPAVSAPASSWDKRLTPAPAPPAPAAVPALRATPVPAASTRAPGTPGPAGTPEVRATPAPASSPEVRTTPPSAVTPEVPAPRGAASSPEVRTTPPSAVTPELPAPRGAAATPEVRTTPSAVTPQARSAHGPAPTAAVPASSASASTAELRATPAAAPTSAVPASSASASTAELRATPPEPRAAMPAPPSEPEPPLTEHLDGKPPAIVELFTQLDKFGRSLEATRRIRLQHVEYLRDERPFFALEVQHERLLVCLSLEPEVVQAWWWSPATKRYTIDIRERGTGQMEYSVGAADQLDDARQLIKLAYDASPSPYSTG